MAKNDVKCADILEEPIAFLYIFIEDFDEMNIPFLAMLDEKHRSIISSKAYNQKVMCRNVYMDEHNDSTEGLQDFHQQIKDKIHDQYGMYPTEILLRLANGENVAGKDWNGGTYGVGESNNKFYKNFSMVTGTGQDLSNISVNDNGTLRFGRGNSANPPNIIYGSDGKPIGYQYDFNGLSLTTQLVNGNWYAGTVGSKNKQWNADGTKFSSVTASSIWQSIATYLPYVGLLLSLLSWLFDSFKSNSWSTNRLFNTSNTFPNQRLDWSYFGDDDEGMTTSDLLLLAAAAGAIYLIASSDEETE